MKRILALTLVVLALAAGAVGGMVLQRELSEQPMAAKLRIAHEAYDGARTEGEAALRKFIDANPNPSEGLRKAIQDHNNTLFKVGRAVFTPELSEYAKRGIDSPLKDVLRDAWQGADAPMKADGEPDFKARDVTRAEVMKRAVAAGVDPEYLTQKTYEPKDPVVAKVLKQYRDDQDMLRPYWEIPDKVAASNAVYADIDAKYKAAQEESKRTMPLGAGLSQQVRELKPVYDLYHKIIELEQAKMKHNTPAVQWAGELWYEWKPPTAAEAARAADRIAAAEGVVARGKAITGVR